MLKKCVSKFAMDILPSVTATIIGAYIVNHYIVTNPGANAPVGAAVSTSGPAAGARTEPARAPGKPSATSVDIANIPEPGVKAKGISERAMLEKTAAEKPPAPEKPPEKPLTQNPVKKPPDKPSETASIPPDTRRHQP